MLEEALPFIVIGFMVILGLYGVVEHFKTKRFLRSGDIDVPSPSTQNDKLFECVETLRKSDECWVYIQFNRAKNSFFTFEEKHDYFYIIVNGECRGSFLMTSLGIAGHIDGGSIRMVKNIIYVNKDNIGYMHGNNASFPTLHKTYSLNITKSFVTGRKKALTLTERPYRGDIKDTVVIAEEVRLPERKMRKSHSILFQVNNPSSAGIVTLLAFRHLENKLYRD